MSGTIDEPQQKRRRTSEGGALVTVKNDDILQFFECPVCLEYALPPIQQCKAGHILCSTCYPEVQVCPTCRVPLQDVIRNLTLEKVAAFIMFPCRNSGCPEILLYSGMTQHEENCNYRPCPCPIPQLRVCLWSRSLDQVKDHVLICCRSRESFGPVAKIIITLTQNNVNKNSVTIITSWEEHFMLLIRCEDRNGEIVYYSYVQLLGNPNRMELYTYRVEVSKGSDHFILETTPRSIYDKFETIRESKCLCIGAALTKQFAENDRLTFTTTIFRKSDSN